MELFERDSVLDLVCRGFTRDEVIERCGVDPGYHGNAVRRQLAGVNRVAYKVAYVRSNNTDNQLDDVLHRYGMSELSKAELLSELGISAGVSEKLINVETLFDELGLGEAFLEADRKRRCGDMTRGMVEAHGVDNPFKLAEVQERAADTREERFGGRYTLSDGSMLAERARETFREHMADDEFRSAVGRKRFVTRAGNTLRREVSLFDEDSVYDLYLRGFTQSDIAERTGVDIGYQGTKICHKIGPVDRVAYQAFHIVERIGFDQLCGWLTSSASIPDGQTFAEAMADFCHVNPRSNTWKPFKVCARLGLENMCRRASRACAISRTQETLMAQHGVASPMLVPGVAEKATRSRCEHMKDENFRKQVREKVRKTSRMRYGTDSPMQNAEVQAKVARTVQMRYGVDCIGKLERVKEARLRGYREQGAAVLEKMRITTRERYGVDYYTQTPEHRAYISRVMSENASVRIPKAQQTNIDKYGVRSYSQTDAFREHMSDLMLSDDMRGHLRQARLENDTYMRSEAEEHIADWLRSQYGDDDVFVQYEDERYPYPCDVYVKSRDLFIEVNGYGQHGCHWYDASSEHDRQRVSDWIAASQGDHDWYEKAVTCWTVDDVKKRAAARQSNLNYVVFWDASRGVSHDFELWVACGCPDGRDWDHIGSWLDEWSHDELHPEFKTGVRGAFGPRIVQDLAMSENWPTFYARELELWCKNDTTVPFGDFRLWMYANRYHYIRRTPADITDRQLLYGIGISCRVRAYSHFDASVMAKWLRELAVSSVYDPCAGWGERLAMCALLGISYKGSDVNAPVVDGDNRLAHRFGFDDEVECVPAEVRDMRNGDHDAVIACPPYGSIETYTSHGAENLDDDAFCVWWQGVVSMSISSATSFFILQTNSRWRHRLSRPVFDAGFSLMSSERLPIQASHRSRKADGAVIKRERESVLVFKRKVLV